MRFLKFLQRCLCAYQLRDGLYYAVHYGKGHLEDVEGVGRGEGCECMSSTSLPLVLGTSAGL